MKSVNYINNPQTNKSQNNNISNCPISKKKLTNFNVMPHTWQQELKTTDGKILKDAEIGVLWTIYRLAKNKKTTELHTTYKDLQKSANKSYISDDQFKRYLLKIQKTNVIQLEAKRIPESNQYNLIIKLNLECLENNLHRTSAPHICTAHLHRTSAPQNTSGTAEVLPFQKPLIDIIDINKERIDIDIDIYINKDEKLEKESSTTISDKAPVEITNIPVTQEARFSNHVNTFGQPFTPAFLRDYKLTPVLLDELKVRSGTDFPNDRIIAVIRNICTKNPETKIFGGRNAFINYMIKVLKNETEYTSVTVDEGKSIADRQRLEWEKLKYVCEHKITYSELERLNIF